MLDSFQERLIGAIRSGEVSGPQIAAIASAMSAAKLQPSDNLVAACDERLGLEADACAAGIDPASVADQIVREHGSDPFDIYEALFAVSHIGSIEFRAAGLQLMISAPAAPMGEAAALAVLNSNPAVRREAAYSPLFKGNLAFGEWFAPDCVIQRAERTHRPSHATGPRH